LAQIKPSTRDGRFMSRFGRDLVALVKDVADDARNLHKEAQIGVVSLALFRLESRPVAPAAGPSITAQVCGCDQAQPEK
jgi:hypothetical protein